MSSGSKNQTTTTQVQIPDEVKPLLSDYFSRANSLSQQPSNYYTAQTYGGQRVADPTQMQRNGIGDMWGQTANAYGRLDTAANQLSNTANGQYLNSNPYLDTVVNNSLGDITRNYQQAVAPGTDAAFARAGAFGGSAWQQAQDSNKRTLADQLGKTSASMRYGDYSQERQNQLASANNLAGIAGMGQGLATNLYNMGTNQQQLDQNQLNGLLAGWTDQQNVNQQNFTNQQQAPLQQLGILGNAINIGMGGASQSTTGPNPNYRSPLQTAIGLGGMVLGAPQTSILGGLFGMGK